MQPFRKYDLTLSLHAIPGKPRARVDEFIDAELVANDAGGGNWRVGKILMEREC